MTPEEIVARGCITSIGMAHETLDALRADGWQLVRATHTIDETTNPEHRIDRFQIEVRTAHHTELLERTYHTSRAALARDIHPEGLLAYRCQMAWTDLALPLGRALEVLA